MNHPFSDTFIRMATIAAEIQAQRPDPKSFQSGDAVVWRCGIGFIGELEICSHGPSEPGPEGSFEEPQIKAWLPLLHQLLEMLGSPEEVFFRWAEPSGSLDLGKYLLPPFKSRDWHGLALEVVMLEKFSKRWDGERWVKI